MSVRACVRAAVCLVCVCVDHVCACVCARACVHEWVFTCIFFRGAPLYEFVGAPLFGAMYACLFHALALSGVCLPRQLE
jgi:hypothetical protein